MPNKNDILIAIKNLDIFLKIPELKGAIVRSNANGQPYFFTGGFTMVFQLTKNLKKWAFRVWYIGFNQQKERFHIISNYLKSQNLSYFADFIYDEKGLLVNGELVDTIRMEWLDGDLLKDYIEKNLNNKKKLQDLADRFMLMCEYLHKHNISHGDLQHGNILVDNNDNIKLIDYDSVCVPAIEGKEELITGLRGYQHPSRFKSANKASLKADYFSELIIYLSLCGLAENPLLWYKFKLKSTEVLLFSEEDFTNLQKSEIYKDLSNLTSKIIKVLLNICTDYLNKPSYLDLKPFQSYLDPAELIQSCEIYGKEIPLPKPEIVDFHVLKGEISIGEFIDIYWSTRNAYRCDILINNGYKTIRYENVGIYGNKKFLISELKGNMNIYLVTFDMNQKESITRNIIVKEKISNYPIQNENVSNKSGEEKPYSSTLGDKLWMGIVVAFAYLLIGAVVLIIGGLILESTIGKNDSNILIYKIFGNICFIGFPIIGFIQGFKSEK